MPKKSPSKKATAKKPAREPKPPEEPLKESPKQRLKKMAEQTKLRQQAYKSRRYDTGQVRIAVWVPKKRADELRLIAKAMCLEKPGKKAPFAPPVLKTSRKKNPVWAYINAEPDEVWLHLVLKANGAVWQNKSKKYPCTWRIRAELVNQLGLKSRVAFEEF